MARFHNPYNFIPNVDRRDLRETDFGDSSPTGHGSHRPGTYRGVLKVKMTTRTPLFVPDASRQRTDNKHVTLPLRKVAGKVHIPPTSVKGMLRSAYETVTLSRYGVMNLSDPLGYRPESRSALDTIPFRVSAMTDDSITFDLHTGSDELGDVHAAAWIPMDRAHRLGHGSKVNVTVEQCIYQRDKRRFEFYAVVAVNGEGINPKLPHAAIRQGGGVDVEGYVYVTSRHSGQSNFPRKHHERVFFDFEDPIQVVFEGDNFKRIVSRWASLIADYQEAAQQAAGRRWDRGAHQRKNNEWNRLKPGSLGYARVVDGVMVDVQPVMISRRLFELSPLDLAKTQAMQPATEIDALSVADRVFGWVSQDRNPDGPGAFKGKVSIGPIRNIEVSKVEESKTLAILSTPRPSHGRFYTGTREGTPWLTGRNKEESGYDAEGARQRGRKVYPHQLMPGFNGQYASGPDGGEQNRTMGGWVDEDSVFSFDLRFEGLTDVELGALLWTINPHPDSDFFHKLGSAKPFGYGSVTLSVADQHVESHADVVAMWSGHSSGVSKLPDFQEAFVTALEEETGRQISEHPVTSTYLKYGKGLSGTVHYPGSGAQYRGQYEWFVANDKNSRLSLPPLGGELGG